MTWSLFKVTFSLITRPNFRISKKLSTRFLGRPRLSLDPLVKMVTFFSVLQFWLPGGINLALPLPRREGEREGRTGAPQYQGRTSAVQDTFLRSFWDKNCSCQLNKRQRESKFCIKTIYPSPRSISSPSTNW